MCLISGATPAANKKKPAPVGDARPLRQPRQPSGRRGMARRWQLRRGSHFVTRVGVIRTRLVPGETFFESLKSYVGFDDAASAVLAAVRPQVAPQFGRI